MASTEARATAAETNARDQALLDQLELQLFELKEDRAQAEQAASDAAQATQADETQAVQAFTRRKPARRPLPEHLPRERVVYPMPAACPCCGGVLHKLGEDVTETLELVPRQWKVIQLGALLRKRPVREKHSCRSCEKITSRRRRRTRSPGDAPDRAAGPRAVRRLGGNTDATVEAVRAHVFAAGRLHADDTTVPVLAVGRTRTGRLWTYVRDDLPFAGADPPAAAYFYSPDRRGEHPEEHLASWRG